MYIVDLDKGHVRYCLFYVFPQLYAFKLSPPKPLDLNQTQYKSNLNRFFFIDQAVNALTKMWGNLEILVVNFIVKLDIIFKMLENSDWQCTCNKHFFNSNRHY